MATPHPALRASGILFLLSALPCPAESLLTNAALGQPVAASGPVFDAARVADMITDGSAASFSHPAAPVAPAVARGFLYTIDLGQVQSLNKLRILNRNDGCCPERLTNYRVSLFAAPPTAAGSLPTWSAVVRANGTHSGSGGVDELLASAHPTGRFVGQWIRLENLNNTAYQPQIAEVEALTSPNLALYKTVTASAAVPSTAPAANLTDGLPSTFSYPDGALGSTLGFFYQLDLAEEVGLDRLVLYTRSDCCPERSANYRISLHEDLAGAPGPARWTGDFHTDGSLPAAATGEVIRPDQGRGEFRGRFLRITNLGNQAASPQFAEIEAYRATPPTIRFFTTDAGNITKTGAPGRPAQALLSWEVQGATTTTLTPGNLSITSPEGRTAVSPDAATTYTLSATNPAGSISATLFIAVDAPQLPPRLNEIGADNANGPTDETGAHPDWIELYNPNAFTLPLAGARLSDDLNHPDPWSFPPGTTLAPQGYLLVFASGQNRRLADAPLHTDFELKKSGEVLSLYAPDGSTLWSRLPSDFPTTLTYPPQLPDTSYGLNAVGQAQYFRPPTPAAPNAAVGFTEVVADPTFSVPRGFYTSAQSVVLSTTTPGATIRYSTNGSRPSETQGSLYSAPIAVTSTTVLRAAAFLPGAAPTGIATHTYIFPNSLANQPGLLNSITGNTTYRPQLPAAFTDIPSISLTLPSTAAINQDREVETAVEWLDSAHPLDQVKVDAAIGLYGGAYTDFAKKSFRLYFRSAYGSAKLAAPLFAGHEHGLHPIEAFDSLELRNGSHDMVDRGFYMSNRFTDEVLLEMGHLAPHGRWVHLYFNGSYWGLYHLRERWNAAMHADYLGGRKQDYEAINGNLNVGGWADPGTPYDGDGRAWEYLKTRRSTYPELCRLVDVPNLVDFMITFMFGNSEDEWRSVSPSRLVGPGSGARFILNDADGWLSINASNAISAWDGSDNNTARAASLSAGGSFNPGRSMGDGPASLFSALLLSGGADHKMLVADRIHRHFFNDGALTPTRNAARLRALCSAAQRPFLAEAARWGNLYRSPTSWAAARDVCLNSWIPTRTATVLAQFKGAGLYPALAAPVYSQNGGRFPSPLSLTLSGPAGALLLYTTDGSDPRDPGGAVNTAPAPQTYSTPLLLSAPTLLRARSRSTAGVWSALQEAFFLPENALPLPPGAVLPSEIHFHPADDGDMEFIELMNVSAAPVNLRGARFSAGIDYAFSEFRDTFLAPGQRLVLSPSEFAYRQHYGWDRPLAGRYFGNLNNAGEALALSQGETKIFDLAFHDDWHPLTDRSGPSLTLIRPQSGMDLNDPENWRPSLAPEGSPSRADPGPAFVGNPSADQDGDGIPALMEYALGTSDTQPNPHAGLTVVPPTAPGETPQFRFTRAAAADDCWLRPQIAQEPGLWHSEADWLRPVSETLLPDGRRLVTVAPGPAMPPGSRAFFRLLATPRP